MIPLTLPHDPARETVWLFPGATGPAFAPAWFPADLIGPVMWCALPVRTDDADLAYDSKYDGPLDPYAVLPAAGYAWGTWLPVAETTAAPVAPAPTPATPWQPITPWWPVWPVTPGRPDHPCDCIVIPPVVPPLPEPAPVPVSASGVLLLTALALLGVMRRARA